MALSPDELTGAIEYLRTVLAKGKERLRSSGGGELDYAAKRDAVLSVKDRYPHISDDQLHEVMQRVEE